MRPLRELAVGERGSVSCRVNAAPSLPPALPEELLVSSSSSTAKAPSRAADPSRSTPDVGDSEPSLDSDACDPDSAATPAALPCPVAPSPGLDVRSKRGLASGKAKERVVPPVSALALLAVPLLVWPLLSAAAPDATMPMALSL